MLWIHQTLTIKKEEVHINVCELLFMYLNQDIRSLLFFIFCISVSLVSADGHDTLSVKSTSMSDFKNAVMSKSARTHQFKKAVDPNRCRECDNNVYFHGVECEVVCILMYG